MLSWWLRYSVGFDITVTSWAGATYYPKTVTEHLFSFVLWCKKIMLKASCMSYLVDSSCAAIKTSKLR